MLIKVISLNVDHLINTDHIVMIKQGEGGNCDFHLSNGTKIMVYASLEDIHLMIEKTKKIYRTIDRIPQPPPDYEIRGGIKRK